MPERQVTVRVCGRCDRESKTLHVHNCLVCGTEICQRCTAPVTGCVVRPEPKPCWDCAQRDDVLGICQEYAPELRRLREERDEKLKNLPEEEP